MNFSGDKGIPHPKKKQRKVSPSLVGSSDESTHEIHWDNDSSTPSQAKKTSKIIIRVLTHLK